MTPDFTIVRAPSHVQFGKKLTEVPLGEGIPTTDELKDEILHYCDVLLGRVDPPVDSPYLDLMEVASAYYARALEIEIMIFNLEHDKTSGVVRGHPLYKFRTGQLRSFIDLSKKMADLGSRRLTQEGLLSEQRYDSGV